MLLSKIKKKLDVVKLLQNNNATGGNVESFAKGSRKQGQGREESVQP